MIISVEQNEEKKSLVMLRCSLRRYCDANHASSTAAAAAASAGEKAASAASASSTLPGRKLYTDRRKKDRIWPFAIWLGVLYGASCLLSGIMSRLHGGHQFLPIYNEKGDLEGFTHPVLVEAGESIRKRKEG